MGHLLKIISKPLYMELVELTFKPTLIEHRFFYCYHLQDRNAMKHMCNAAVSSVSLSGDEMSGDEKQGDKLFTEGASDSHMFFIVKGLIRYTQTRSNTYPPRAVKPGGWLGEAALWTDWVHVGTATAVLNSEVLSVNSDSFSEVTTTHRRVLRQTAHYARIIFRKINEYFEERSFLSDLLDSSEEDEDIVDEAAAIAFKELLEATMNCTRSTTHSLHSVEKLQAIAKKYISHDANGRPSKSEGNEEYITRERDLDGYPRRKSASDPTSPCSLASTQSVASPPRPYFLKQPNS